ncbi:MAG: TonB-dependent receptor [Polyangiales bacterium]
MGTGQAVRTDLDGAYELSLSPGRYRLRFEEDVYEILVRDDVMVAPAEFAVVDAALTLNTGKLQDEAVIVTRFNVRSAAAQLQARRDATVVKDAISAEEMQRTPDSNAGDSARRVPGVSVVGGRYLVVRGLSGRYTNALLNGVRLPNSDPDEPGVQLDLFPRQMLNSLSVTKTFSPDIPGNFAGGSLQLETRDFPDAFTLEVQLTTNANTESIGQQVLTYDGGSLDFLGLDDGTRGLPSDVPTERVIASARGLSRADVDEVARSFPNRWTRSSTTGIPDIGVSVTAGDTLKLGGHKLGILSNVNYGHNWRQASGTVGKTRVGAGDRVELAEDLKTETGTRQVTWGALSTVTYEASRSDELSFVGMWNHASEDTTRVARGHSDNEGADIVAQRFRLVERNLGVVQLLGDHTDFGLLAGSRLKWQLNGSFTGRDEPDTRDVMLQEENDAFFWRDVPGSGERLYSGLTQWDGGGGFDFAFPVGFVQAKTGALAQYTDRGFTARRFGLAFVGNSADDRFLPLPELFAADNVGTLTRLQELTRSDDSYQANQLLLAGYAMADAKLLEWLRVVGGARIESFGQHVESYSPFPEERKDAIATDRTDTDALPSASLIFGLSEKMFVRAAYGGTVARPEVRELAPFLYQDFVRRRTVQGNPDLLRTYIHNFDLRWEWFFGDTEVVAFSAFYKDFRHPIEQVVQDRQGNVTYDNVDGATNFGGEAEVRVGLGHLHPGLGPFSIGGNVSLIRSSVELSDAQRGTATSAERPLAGQSPYVANLSLGCALPDIGLTSFVYYNVFGKRIEEVGKLGLPDVYQEPFHSLDVSAAWEFATHWKLTVTASNILFSKVELKQGPFTVQRRDPGATFGAKLGWTY